MATQKPQLTLWFLNASRAVRVAWMLEALQLPYELVRAERASNGLAPPEFREKIPGSLRKSPTIQDGDLILQESGAILEYLCETYDKEHVFLPKDPKHRTKVQEWLSASEGTFAMHGIAVS
jgi:glutathione S-transferase